MSNVLAAEGRHTGTGAAVAASPPSDGDSGFSLQRQWQTQSLPRRRRQVTRTAQVAAYLLICLQLGLLLLWRRLQPWWLHHVHMHRRSRAR